MFNDAVHIAIRAVLAGNVSIGERTFVGANAVIKQGIVVGKDVVIGAGTVVITNIPDEQAKVVGNPGRIILKMSKVIIIAEAGVNHNGDIQIAKS